MAIHIGVLIRRCDIYTHMFQPIPYVCSYIYMDPANDYNLFYYTKRTVKWNGIINELVLLGGFWGDDDE